MYSKGMKFSLSKILNRKIITTFSDRKKFNCFSSGVSFKIWIKKNKK